MYYYALLTLNFQKFYGLCNKISYYARKGS